MANHDSSIGSPDNSSAERNINSYKSETAQSESFDEEEGPTGRQWREMREDKLKDSQDLSLQSPQDANTEKHINFLQTNEAGSTTDESSKEEESDAQRQWREMREEKIKNNQDVSLQTPQDANTQKHINFLDEESERSGND